MNFKIITVKSLTNPKQVIVAGKQSPKAGMIVNDDSSSPDL